MCFSFYNYHFKCVILLCVAIFLSTNCVVVRIFYGIIIIIIITIIITTTIIIITIIIIFNGMVHDMTSNQGSHQYNLVKFRSTH